MPVNGKEQTKGRPLSRRYLCCMLADDKNAGHLLAFIIGWHKHATLPRKGRTGLWNAFSLAKILAGAKLTPKPWYRVKPLLEGFAYIEGGGFAGKRVIWTQPCLTAQAESFLAGEYRTKAEARKALALLKGNLKQVTQVPVGSVPGQNQGQNPILSTLPSLPTKKTKTLKGLKKGKEKQLDSKNKSQYEGKKMPDSAQESIHHTATPHAAAHSASAHTQQHPEEPGQTDAKLYPEVPIPKGCPLKHPRHHYGKRWATFSPKVKADLYTWFQQALENWKNGKAGKHATSIYGFGKNDSGKFAYPTLTMEEDEDPEWAQTSAKIASWNEDEDG